MKPSFKQQVSHNQNCQHFQQHEADGAAGRERGDDQYRQRRGHQQRQHQHPLRSGHQIASVQQRAHRVGMDLNAGRQPLRPAEQA